MLIDVSRYAKSLKKLWIDTFGDSEDYVNLLFDNGYKPSECFAEVINDEVISVLYLLKGYIQTETERLEGRYLYAAATDISYRGKGLMAKLINEAKQYVSENSISFISLVPADEGLYGYYAKFGFKPIMKHFVSIVDNSAAVCSDKSDISEGDLITLRKNTPTSYFYFGDKEWRYAFSCLRYAGFNMVRNSDDSYYIISEDGCEVLEYISASENFKENTEMLLRSLNKGTVITSPYDLSDYCETKENKFGMVYFASETIDISGDVYMNIALD